MTKNPTRAKGRAIGPRKTYKLPDGTLAGSMVEIVMWHLWEEGSIKRSFFTEKYGCAVTSFSGSGTTARERLAERYGLRLREERNQDDDFEETYIDGDVVYSIKNFHAIKGRKSPMQKEIKATLIESNLVEMEQSVFDLCKKLQSLKMMVQELHLSA